MNFFLSVIFIKTIKLFIQGLFRFIIFTGAWISILLIVGLDYSINYLSVSLGYPKIVLANYPTFFPKYELIMVIIGAIPLVYFTTRNIIRIVIGNSEFSLIDVLTKRWKIKKEKI